MRCILSAVLNCRSPCVGTKCRGNGSFARALHQFGWQRHVVYPFKGVSRASPSLFIRCHGWQLSACALSSSFITPTTRPSPARAHPASKIGSGRVGHVYALDDSKTNISDPSNSDVFVHPLVVKVGGRDTSLSTDLAKEAWNYGEMECIQGVAIPRCYGISRLGFQMTECK